MKRLAFTLAFVVGLLVLVQAQTSFVADFDDALAFVYNWDSAETPSAEWSRTAVAGGGPSGQDVLRLTSEVTLDGEFGWGNSNTMTAPSAGTVLYVRWYQRWTATTDFEGSDPGGPIPYMRGKMFMFPPSGGTGDRVSVNWESQHSPTTGFAMLYVGIASGGPSTHYILERGVWSAFQLRITPGTSCGAGDGSLRIWVDNDVVGSPTQVSHDGTNYIDDSTGLDICSADQTSYRLGAYVNSGMASGGVHAMEFAAFELGTAFDANWHASMGGVAVPDPPTIGTATPGNTSCVVTFTPPADDGGATITSYTATSSPSSITGTAASSPITVTGLSNGTGYTFTVTATNSEGTSSASSASNTCTPSAAGSGPTRLRIRGEN